jgi:hypothetical protein
LRDSPHSYRARRVGPNHHSQPVSLENGFTAFLWLKNLGEISIAKNRALFIP